jgi:hypothetical protein
MKLASRIEKEIFATHNQIRITPKSFLPLIDNQLKNFQPGTSNMNRFGRPDLIT